jgi:hypothetical protein
VSEPPHRQVPLDRNHALECAPDHDRIREEPGAAGDGSQRRDAEEPSSPIFRVYSLVHVSSGDEPGDGHRRGWHRDAELRRQARDGDRLRGVELLEDVHLLNGDALVGYRVPRVLRSEQDHELG